MNTTTRQTEFAADAYDENPDPDEENDCGQDSVNVGTLHDTATEHSVPVASLDGNSRGSEGLPGTFYLNVYPPKTLGMPPLPSTLVTGTE